jgi:hypothetical protein
MMKNYSLIFRCPLCEAIHFTCSDDNDKNTLYRMSETPIHECFKCVEIHDFAESLK